MGLFGGNWSAPGPGVDKDAPKKKGVFLYFEIFLRKFWNILHLNVVYFTASILFIVLLYIIAPVPNTVVERMADGMQAAVASDIAADSADGKAAADNSAEPSLTPEQKAAQQRESIIANIQVGLRSMFAVMVLVLWGCAPMSAGYAYITRCFSREQHAWIWSDFKDKVIENFKQSAVVLIVDIAVLFLAVYSAFFYYMSYLSTLQHIWLVFCSLICMMMVIYTMMHYYIYQIMVTFRCTLKQLYKNAFLLAIAKLPMNLLLTAIAAALVYLAFIALSPAVAVGLSFFLWVSMARFPIEFYSSRVLQKLIINGAQNKVDKKEDER